MQIIPGGISKIKAVATTTFVYKVFPPKTRRGYVIFNRLKTAIFRTNADQKSYSFSLIPGGKKTKKPAQKRWLRFENVLFRYDYIDVDELLAAREDYRKKENDGEQREAEELFEQIESILEKILLWCWWRIEIKIGKISSRLVQLYKGRYVRRYYKY